jgi:hypothetical protein|tara:strand:+ start:7676 stop:7795 length:120 start_codon:yes stop_codon:yes gene_type:complete
MDSNVKTMLWSVGSLVVAATIFVKFVYPKIKAKPSSSAE